MAKTQQKPKKTHTPANKELRSIWKQKEKTDRQKQKPNIRAIAQPISIDFDKISYWICCRFFWNTKQGGEGCCDVYAL